MIYGWSPGIGDPDPFGWFTVVAYAVAAALCFRAARRGSNRTPDTRRFWMILAIALLALGINKQLDLQSLLTAVGRHVARAQGWYGGRRGPQVAFIGAVAIGGVALAIGLVRHLRDRGAAARLAGWGCGALLAFVLIRAVSLEHVDALLAFPIAGVRINHVLELGGIAVIAAAAARARIDDAAAS